MNQFLMLLRKDWRVNRVPVVVLLLTSMGAYLLVCANYLWELHLREFQFRNYDIPSLGSQMGDASVFGFIFLMPVAAAFGGNAFAAERREGSADFLGIIPISRRLIVFSKLTVAAACILAAWLVHSAVLCIGYRHSIASEADDCLGWLATALVLFGLWWLCSTFLQSAAISAVIAMAVYVAAFFSANLWREYAQSDLPSLFIREAGELASFATGLLALAFGNFYYARRVAP